jgi:hypothetical protein
LIQNNFVFKKLEVGLAEENGHGKAGDHRYSDRKKAKCNQDDSLDEGQLPLITNGPRRFLVRALQNPSVGLCGPRFGQRRTVSLYG